jgi:hypothetical protein
MNVEDIAALEAYAARLELTRTAVFSLAVQRELRVPQLEPHKVVFRTHALGGKRTGTKRVTIHLRSKAMKDAFTRHAKVLGYGSDEAAWTVIQNELHKENLLKALAFSWNHA